MSVYVAVLTYRPKATGRLELLAATVASLRTEADAVWVVDNGSGDEETAAIADVIGAKPWTHYDSLTTCGHGTNLQARILAGSAQPGDICVLSDDDMVWRKGWRKQLARWWRKAPADVLLTGCHLEPLYPWNTVEGRDDFPALFRLSTGAASWSYRAESHGLIFPIPERVQGEGDVHACKRIRSKGRIAQLDLADHVGTVSTWGNRTAEMFGQPDESTTRSLLDGAA